MKKSYQILQFAVFLLFFTLNSNIYSGDDIVYVDDKTTISEEYNPPGYWKLSNLQTVNTNNGWKGINGSVKYFHRWVDYLTIQHTVDCAIKWNELPLNLKAGEEIKLAAEFISSEYSTTSALQTGIRIIVECNNPVIVFDMRKNVDNHYNENRNSKLTVPKCNDSKTMRVIIECYSGNSKYASVYNYEWTNE